MLMELNDDAQTDQDILLVLNLQQGKHGGQDGLIWGGAWHRGGRVCGTREMGH